MNELRLVWKGNEAVYSHFASTLPERWVKQPVKRVFYPSDAFEPLEVQLPSHLRDFKELRLDENAREVAVGVVESLNRNGIPAQLQRRTFVGSDQPPFDLCPDQTFAPACVVPDAHVVVRPGTQLTSVPPLFPFQQYMSPVHGIGVVNAWAFEGGKGRDVTVADFELGWGPHNDFGTRLTFLGGKSGSSDPLHRSHGTAVMGIVGARPDSAGNGAQGVAPDADLIAVPTDDESIESVENALVNAVTSRRMPRGSVFLVESQHVLEMRCPEDCLAYATPYLPLEATIQGFEALKCAVDAGYVVVQAAANGSPGRNQGVDIGPFIAGRDSGSIMVGAGKPFDGRRLPTSNFGTRVDLSSWGAGVVTCGALEPSRFSDLFRGPCDETCYTASFDATSSAAAIVAGAVACIVGIAKAHGVSALDPRLLRDVLKETGRMDRACPEQPIGPQPDLLACIGRLRSLGVLPMKLKVV